MYMTNSIRGGIKAPFKKGNKRVIVCFDPAKDNGVELYLEKITDNYFFLTDENGVFHRFDYENNYFKYVDL